MSQIVELTEEQISVLRQYAHTSDVNFMQGVKGASELNQLGLLEWHGTSYGCNFYSITDTGHDALRSTNVIS